MASLKPLWLSLRDISTRMRENDAMWVGCDFDGTLTDIVDRHELAVLKSRTRKVLEELSNVPGVRLGVFSGRPLDDLSKIFSWSGLFVAGAAGLETRDELGRRKVHVSQGEALPAGLRERMEEWCTRYQGAW